MWLELPAMSTIPICSSVPVDNCAACVQGCSPQGSPLCPAAQGSGWVLRPPLAAALLRLSCSRSLHRLLLPPQSNKIEKAVSAAHTFLQKNPKHEMTLRYLNYYRTMLDVDEYLIDLEAQPYEVRRGGGWGRRGAPQGSKHAWSCQTPREEAALPH